MENCGACFVLCTTCGENCEYKKYFPRDKANDFAILSKVFGVNEIITMIRQCKPDDQADCIDTLLAEARLRIVDPVRGCGGKLLKTKRKLKEAKEKIEVLQKTKDSYMAEIQKVKDLYTVMLQQQVAAYTQVAANNRPLKLPKVAACSSQVQPTAYNLQLQQLNLSSGQAQAQAQPQQQKIDEAQKAKDSYMASLQQQAAAQRATPSNMQLQLQQVAAHRATTNKMQLPLQQVAAYNSQAQQTAHNVQAQQVTAYNVQAQHLTAYNVQLAAGTTAQPKPKPKPQSDYESMYI